MGVIEFPELKLGAIEITTKLHSSFSAP